jgi:hypothetical protein
MSEDLNSLKLTIFELISYVFPRLLVIILGLVFFPPGLSILKDNVILVSFFSYIIGNLLHQLSESNLNLRQYGWKIYHWLKEKDEKGHGIENPTGRIGRLMKWFRHKWLEKKKDPIKDLLNVTGILKEKCNVDEVTPYDLYFLKEAYLINQPSLAGYYQYLLYQKIFNKSLSLIFFLTAVLLIILDYFKTISVNIYPGLSYSIDGKGLIISAGLILLSLVFKDRSRFFKDYRDKILDMNVLMTFGMKKA